MASAADRVLAQGAVVLTAQCGQPLTFRERTVIGVIEWLSNSPENYFLNSTTRLHIPADQVESAPVEDEYFTDEDGRVHQISSGPEMPAVTYAAGWWICLCRVSKANV